MFAKCDFLLVTICMLMHVRLKKHLHILGIRAAGFNQTQTDGRTDGFRTDGQTDRHTDRRTDTQTDRDNTLFD